MTSHASCDHEIVSRFERHEVRATLRLAFGMQSTEYLQAGRLVKRTAQRGLRIIECKRREAELGISLRPLLVSQTARFEEEYQPLSRGYGRP